MRCVLIILRIAASMSLTQVISLILWSRKNVNPLKTGTGTVSASAERKEGNGKKETERRGAREGGQSNEVINNYLLIGSPTIFR